MISFSGNGIPLGFLLQVLFYTLIKIFFIIIIIVVVEEKHQTPPSSFTHTFAQAHRYFYYSLLPLRDGPVQGICQTAKHRGTEEQLSRIPVLNTGCAYFCLVSSSFCWLRCKSKLHGQLSFSPPPKTSVPFLSSPDFLPLYRITKPRFSSGAAFLTVHHHYLLVRCGAA